MKKVLYTFSALMMSCIMSFSGIGGTYLQARASSGAFDSLWNTDASAWENIKKHINLWCAAAGVITNPVSFAINADDFYQYMVSDGRTKQEAHDVMCGCGESHESCAGYVHGGGFVHDGITRDNKGNVTYSDEVSDLFHGYVLDYLNSNNGYILYKTPTIQNIGPDHFKTKECYENAIKTMENLGLLFLEYSTNDYYCFYYVPTENFYSPYENMKEGIYFNGSCMLCKNGSHVIMLKVLENDWSCHHAYKLAPQGKGGQGKQYHYSFSSSYSLDYFEIDEDYYYEEDLLCTQGSGFNGLFSDDGRVVKIWYNLSLFKKYSIGQQPYYCTNTWVNYDASVDNSVTMTENQYQYYYDNSSTIYQTIQNNVSNANEEGNITEQDVQKNVDNAVAEILKEMENNNSGSVPGDSSNGSGDNAGGSGVLDIVDGISKLLDTILSLIGKLMGVVADFTTSILDLFFGFTSFTDGFSDFLASAFTFIPVEIWDLIKAGLGLIILLSVIKLLRG